MTKQHTCHLPDSTPPFCMGIARFGLPKTLLRLCSAIVIVSDIPALGR
jgi:hypothetical protein